MKSRIFAILSAVIIMTVIGCGDPVPIQEMTRARSEIDLAESVKAMKYAPKEIDAARIKLLESHDFVVKEKMEDARKSALVAYDAAHEAYNKSIPLLAKDTIAEAERNLAIAEKAYAEKLAATAYDGAVTDLDRARALNTEEKYYDAYLAASDADRKAREAQNSSLSKKDILQDSIAEVKLTIQKARGYENAGDSADKIQLAEEKVGEAEVALQAEELKSGFEAVAVAKISADEALVGAAEGTARVSLADAETLFARAEKSTGAAVAADEMAASRESLDNAKSMYSQGRYSESIEYSRESSRLATLVLATRKTRVDGTVSSGSIGKEDPGGTVVGEDQDYIMYKVKYRERLKDCLWRIAGTFYKDPFKWKIIYAANRDRITDPDLIKPGWILKIPKLPEKK